MPRPKTARASVSPISPPARIRPPSWSVWTWPRLRSERRLATQEPLLSQGLHRQAEPVAEPICIVEQRDKRQQQACHHEIADSEYVGEFAFASGDQQPCKRKALCDEQRRDVHE